MTLASVLRHFYHHAQAGSGTLRDCRPLSCFLQPASSRHPAYRQSLLLRSLHASSCNRNSDLRRQRVAPAASVSDAPASIAVEEQLQWDEAEQDLDPQQVLVLPAPSHSRVKTAEFVKSSTAVSQCPPSKHPEFAVIGRSNVGKSSLINMLTGKKALAQISKTPGQLTCYCLQYSPNFCRLGNDTVMQAKRSASTTSLSTIPGFWLTSLDMGKSSDQRASSYLQITEPIYVGSFLHFLLGPSTGLLCQSRHLAHMQVCKALKGHSSRMERVHKRLPAQQSHSGKRFSVDRRQYTAHSG